MARLTLVLVLALLAAVPAGGARTAKRVSIFYYPWYGTPERDGGYLHWQQDGHLPPRDIASAYYPSRGPYSSSDPRVLSAQMREIATAGVGEVVSSWWGWGSVEDARLPAVITAARAQGLSVAVQLEPYEGRSITSVSGDVDHLRSLGITRFYVYRPWDLRDDGLTALNDRFQDAQLLAQTANVSRAAAAHFDGIYTYDILKYGASDFGRICARAHVLRLLCAPSVGPGYDASRATDDGRIKARRGGRTYDAMWRAAIASGADAVTITSYNEWHEGTQIEPALTGAPTRLPTSSPVEQVHYETYDGAYGLRGRAAGTAYLARTAAWVRAFRGGPEPDR